VNNVIRDVDFYRCMCNIVGCRVLLQMGVGRLLVVELLLSIHLCKCIWKFTKTQSPVQWELGIFPMDKAGRARSSWPVLG